MAEPGWIVALICLAIQDADNCLKFKYSGSPPPHELWDTTHPSSERHHQRCQSQRRRLQAFDVTGDLPTQLETATKHWAVQLSEALGLTVENSLAMSCTCHMSCGAFKSTEYPVEYVCVRFYKSILRSHFHHSTHDIASCFFNFHLEDAYCKWFDMVHFNSISSSPNRTLPHHSEDPLRLPWEHRFWGLARFWGVWSTWTKL